MRRSRSKEAIRAEAAAWVTRLKDAHSRADRERFEEWIAEDPAHRPAYDRAAAVFDAAGALRASEIGRKRDLESAFGRRRPAIAGRLVTAVVALLLVGAYQFSSGFNPFRPTALASVMFSTGAEPRNVTLADGSRISMEPASEVRIELGRSERLAEVRKGRVRVTVRSEKRPFTIMAGNSRLRATQGVFDAQLISGEGVVAPLRPRPEGKTTALNDAPLAGQRSQQPESIRQRLEFNAEPLGRAIERINQVRAGPPIELERGLSNLQVTGVFQQGGSESVARSLALAFDLDLVETSTGALRLTRKK